MEREQVNRRASSQALPPVWRVAARTLLPQSHFNHIAFQVTTQHNMLNMGVKVHHPTSVWTFPALSPLPGQVQ